jgi:hypothetical protein
MQLVVSVSVKRRWAASRIGSSFSDQHNVRVSRHSLTQLTHDLVGKVLIAIIEVMLPGIASKANPKGIAWPPHVFAQPIDSVNAKTIDSPIEPESDDIPHGGPHGRMLPVQIRL